MDKTYVLKGKPACDWLLVDANEKTLGRVASQIARYLLGKHKPTFTPGVEMGDYVVVVNASHVRVTGNRLEEKFYYSHSGYPGGLKSISLKEQLLRHPDRVIQSAVWGMLPHNRIGRRLIGRLKVYGGADHPHAAQNPKVVD